ncbi:putative glyocosyltransferase protein [Brachyspira suanatina]|uniref:Putative glyocosyltransferase protein n=1 Tax=Brachyspira suanatina TaxID=381802 RepID=A0A0G4K7J9_9SPIR|nr:hypothetical protein [Brachyspira suanatina]CRF33646.1 putative glyocosyltransferase protein [Brachyspira suanatina]
MNKAVLLIVFNRFDTAKKVFEAIREVKPPRLYVAADGPRKNKRGEYKKCMKVREIIKYVDWECEVKTLFRDENLGCGKAVSGAINWFFENEEDGIILEDDCLPNKSFFYYCEELLNYYKDNEKIMHIGSNHIGEPYSEYTYNFTSIMRCWGWASWRRAWKHFDFTLKRYDYKDIERKIEIIYKDKNMQHYWKSITLCMMNLGIDTWDYQWVISIIANEGLCIDPNINLVSNIGFTKEGTHTFDSDCNVANLPTYNIEKIIHPPKIERNMEIDEKILHKWFGVKYLEELIPEVERLNYIITKIIDKIAWYIPIRSIRNNWRDKFKKKMMNIK